MTKSYYRNRIESVKRDIEREKSKISGYREDIAKIRIKKSRSTESYRNRIKAASTTSRKQAIRAQKSREWESIAKKIEGIKNNIDRSRKRISNFRDTIKRHRESMKRARK